MNKKLLELIDKVARKHCHDYEEIEYQEGYEQAIFEVKEAVEDCDIEEQADPETTAIKWAEANGYTLVANDVWRDAKKALEEQQKDKGEISDGYHTFNQLYHQRAVLFAVIVNQNKDKAWKSWKHSDGKYCFDSNGEWFIVGVDTPKGSYTYHYNKDYWDMFECEELECGKEWDGHTEKDVIRLLSLEERKEGRWERHYIRPGVYADLWFHATCCGGVMSFVTDYCPHCGARMIKEDEQDARK